MSRVAHSSCTKYCVKKWLWCCLLTELFNKYLYRSLSPLAISIYLLVMKSGRGLSPGALSWDEYNFIPIDDHLGLTIRAMQVPCTLLLTVQSLTLDPFLSLNHDHFMVETCVPVSGLHALSCVSGRVDGKAELPTAPFTRSSRLPVFRAFFWWHQRVFGD